MGSIKRAPELKNSDHFARYHKMSKADIVEAYRDLFRACMGVELEDEEWMTDLEERVVLLKNYRTGKYVS